MARNRLLNLAERLEPEVRAAFLAAVADIGSLAEVARIADRLEAGDIDGALEALHIDRAAFHGLDAAIASTFTTGGQEITRALPRLKDAAGARVVIRFDVRNTRAENWLRTHSATLVTRITTDQQVGLRAALDAGLQAGRNPRSVALDLVGRIDRASGRRVGGIVGLTSAQMQAVERARAELASGNTSQLRSYLDRKLRDRRFDRHALAAIEGKAIPADTIARMVSRYADRQLLLRGETIARTETLAALHEAQDEAFRQAVDSGAIAASQVRRAWHTAGDGRVRETHAGMNGESVGLGEPFTSPSGAQLMYPCDPAAPPEETINCRCWVENRIDFLTNIS